ncbi:MAG TPA: sigma-54 dependent transcriptional regulator [Thermoanaerobaculia bacterium]|nr:sigma-54 dependent transcriptional regulator [Thermoanaerobaculia bacterium]
MPETPPVLIVDDQPAVVRALGVLLDLHEIPHQSAASPSEALAIARRQPLAAVIQDMNFAPGETSGRAGVELFHALRQVDPELPVFLITAWTSLETAVELVREGAADYLQKPWDDGRLVATLRELLAARARTLEAARRGQEVAASRAQLAAEHDLRGLVYASPAMHRAVALALSVAPSDAPVLFTGPSGSGKERLAEIVQASSPRRGGPFVRVNVGAIPDSLLEAELFGAEPGAYTGLRSRRVGHFEAAHAGTLFLDEVDSLPLAGQVKLLRVLQSGELMRLGSSRSQVVDVRVLSATNARLDEAMASGRFREDLYFRLNVVEVRVPSLRERHADVLPLARHFLDRFAAERGEPLRLGAAAEEALLAHDWPGNVRELENRVRRACLLAGQAEIAPGDLGLGAEAEAESPSPPLSADEEGERLGLLRRLAEVEGNVSRAAEALGISRQALYRRMARLGIEIERRPKP